MGANEERAAGGTHFGNISRKVLTATRFWAGNAGDVSRLVSFLNRASTYSDFILVAINTDVDTEDTSRILSNVEIPSEVRVIPVSPWGGVTHALNLLVQHSLSHYPSVAYVLFQSPEVIASQSHVHELYHILHKGSRNVLVAAHALPGHQMHGVQPDITKASLADATPWNTFAMWDVGMLGHLGFPAIADRMHPPGMEEVAAIAVQQRLYGRSSRKAVLVCNKGVDWHTEFQADRSVAHKHKMASKTMRAKSILKSIGVTNEEEFCVLLVHSEDLGREGNT